MLQAPGAVLTVCGYNHAQYKCPTLGARLRPVPRQGGVVGLSAARLLGGEDWLILFLA